MREVGDLMRRKPEAVSSPCVWDDHRSLGCALGCPCGHWQKCYPSYEIVVNRAKEFQPHLVDVGVCGTAYREPFLLTLLVPVLLLGVALLVKRRAASGEAVKQPARSDALCDTKSKDER
ncbi:unnamed protein product [Effrenium voratum]|nr:unnamed protein product [Effrenium voratum]|mmetsp:Transcript_97560/g.232258  ORF Transcript_97560/g.232258 Transcript_97560/m.232258 type:complete len:119 (+) Transcript_97560:45-401(+)